MTTASTSSTTAPPNEGDPDMDLVLARTAASLENLAVLSYSVVLGESDVSLPAEIDFDQAVIDAATLFREHHQAHADAVNAVLTDAGEAAYTEPNPYLLESVVQPDLANLTNQDRVVGFARDLENIAAGTYAYAASVLSTARSPQDDHEHRRRRVPPRHHAGPGPRPEREVRRAPGVHRRGARGPRPGRGHPHREGVAGAKEPAHRADWR